MPEFIDPFFAKESPKRSFSLRENERFVLVFVKTGSTDFGHRRGTYLDLFIFCPNIWILTRDPVPLKDCPARLDRSECNTIGIERPWIVHDAQGL